MNPLLASLRGRLIVSCQASEGDAFRSEDSMARFAAAAVAAGAGGIRADSAGDIRAIRARVPVPIIGIRKSVADDGRVLITPDLESARALVAAGADIVALDCTARGVRYGALDRLRRIRAELGVPVMADIATLDEALAAAEAGADLVASTMRGYTDETVAIRHFEPAFIRDLVARLQVPVLAEGRINTPAEAAAAMHAGAFAAIVGTAITRPHVIARWFADAVAIESGPVAAIDMGGTGTKFGIVTTDGVLHGASTLPTPFSAGRTGLLAHLRKVVTAIRDKGDELDLRPASVGLATAGWVDPGSGRVVYATENLPGWTDTELGKALTEAAGMPVYVENDANALAVGEHRFGAAQGARDFICITIGTGVGGGCYTGGRLIRGSHFFGNALGHIPVVPDGERCTCGLRGCLEAYTGAAALLRLAGGRFPSALELIQAAGAGDPIAADAVSQQAKYLAMGLSAAIQLLDPQLLILSGGLTENNPLLLRVLEEELNRRISVPDRRAIEVRKSDFGYHAGVLGAAAVAMSASRGAL